jgi:hypothetical protein
VQQWADDNPYFLVCVAAERHPERGYDTATIDLGEQGWHVKHSEWMRRPSEWYLCEKAAPQRAVLALIVNDGDQPYYVKKHVGQMELDTGRSRSLVVHGIGKKVPATPDAYERTDRIWILPHGVICGGEDVERLAIAVVSTMEWQDPPDEASTG